MNVILIGMMASGKSAVGNALAQKLGRTFLDTDQIIEETAGLAIAEIFKQQGETYFRELEKKAVRQACAAKNAVIATGGGAPCLPENWRALSNSGQIFWLKALPETLFQRVQNTSPALRPLLAKNLSPETISRILQTREKIYAQADITIETDQLSTEEITQKIIGYLK